MAKDQILQLLRICFVLEQKEIYCHAKGIFLESHTAMTMKKLESSVLVHS